MKNVNIDETLSAFKDFCEVDLQLASRTVYEHVCQIARFLKAINKNPMLITDGDVRGYLKGFSNSSANTRANVLKSLKRFFRDFLRRKEVVESFKFPERPFYVKEVPSKEQIQKFYNALMDPASKALFLIYAASGLRRNEVLALRIQDIDFEKRMIIPKKEEQNQTKHTWVSFFNEEAERVLRGYLENRTDADPLLFPVSNRAFRKMWRQGREKTGIRITPQVLREWFCSVLGELNVPDRYADAFCGRTPKSVLAKHYTDYAPEKLRRIYDAAKLTVLS